MKDNGINKHFRRESKIMLWLMLASILGGILIGIFAPYIINEDDPEVLYRDMLSICEAHPEFRASSVDFYDPKKSEEYVKRFHNLAMKFREQVDMLYLLPRLKKVSEKEATCIESIQNTWPG